jgi:predicted CXXCH cytochrome family protein
MTGVNQEGSIPSNRKSNLGIDLTGTHPVSVKFTQNLALMSKNLVWPAGDRKNSDLLDADGFVQCTTCHDPHSSASEKYPFWKRATFSEVCEACHQY